MLTRCLQALTISLPVATFAAPPMVLDGRFDDWATASIVMNDATDDASGAEIDLGAIAAIADERYLHLRVQLGRTVNIQRLDGQLRLVLNADADDATGARIAGLDGTDLVLVCTPRDDRRDRAGMGIGLHTVATGQVEFDRAAGSPYDVGFTFAPTYADDEVEIRLDRAHTMPRFQDLLRGTSVLARLVYANERGEVKDETDTFRITMPPFQAPAEPTFASDPLARAPGTALRVVSWNSERGALFERPREYAAVLRAIDPDVILFQEMTGRRSGRDLAGLLNAAFPVPNGRWSVVWGEGGGNLRTAVASRLPLTPVDSMRLLTFPDNPDRQVRVAAATVQTAFGPIMAVSVHLKCCGRIDSSEDEKRDLEADLIIGALRRAVPRDGSVGVIVAGDLNLVGGYDPLRRLRGVGSDGKPWLSVADALQLDGRLMATWSDPDLPFVPGRLDFVLHDASTVPMRGAFVLETTDLPQRWLTTHGLKADATARASDHLPVVVDFGPRPASAGSSGTR